MAFQRDSKLGYGYLLVGLAVPPLTDNFFGHTAGLIAYALSFLVGIIFLLAAHHDRLLQRRSFGVTIVIFTIYGAVIGALGGGLTGAILRARVEKSATGSLPVPPPRVSTPEETAPHDLRLTPSKSPVQNHHVSSKTNGDKPPTLLELFKTDFPNTLKITTDAVFNRVADGSEIRVKRQAYLDVDARTKFIGFYIPFYRSRDETIEICLTLINMVQPTIKELTSGDQVIGGNSYGNTSSGDLVFSGRVFLYYEGPPFSITQQGQIVNGYKASGYDAQFRDLRYVTDQDIAWYTEHGFPQPQP